MALILVSAAPASAATSCTAGSYFDSATGGCVPAPPGTFVATAGATAPTPCAPGYYQPDSGATECLPAPAGTYVDVPGAIAANPCALGTYQPNLAATACLPAPAGSYVGTTGATSTTLCALGTYAPDAGSAACLPAPAGSYVDTTGATSATLCAVGTYAPEAGSAVCLPAPAGSYVGTTGATSATPCALGTYAPVAGSAACLPAPAGTYVDTTGATSATPCALGTYAPVAGSAACLPAPAGTYVDTTGATSATPCALGAYAPVAGSAACLPAPAGTYVDTTGATSATPCALGAYAPEAGSAACLPAPPGSYVDTLGATSATPCPAGTVQPLSGQAACYSVPITAGASGTSLDSGGTATASAGGITGTATGAGSITVALYGENPAAPPTFAASGVYFDAAVLPGAAFTSLTLQACDLQNGDTVLWWSGTGWLPVSDQTFDTATGCVTMTFSATTSPSLVHLTGTPFAAAIVPPEASISFAPPPAGAPNLHVTPGGAIPASVSGPACSALTRGPHEDGTETCTYTLAAGPGATLTVQLRLHQDGHELKASVTSLTYTAGPTTHTITPPPNTVDFEWSVDRAGHLEQLQERLQAGEQAIAAHYNVHGGVTELDSAGHKRPITQPGLVLLTLTTHDGDLVIGS